MMTVTIRVAEKSDVRGLADLIEEIERFYGAADADIQPFDKRRDQVEDALFGSPPLASALLAKDETGNIVGLAAYSYLWPSAGSTHSLFLKELYIRDALRREGIGERLLNELRTIAAARPGCSRIEWMTDRDNPCARAFYKSLGFAESDGKILYRVGTGAA
ncbi:cyclophane-containing RiPP N-acetyltransferase HaaN [Streptomyces sp. NPDC001939]